MTEPTCETLVFDIDWFMRYVAPFVGSAKSMTFSNERVEQIKVFVERAVQEGRGVLIGNTALIANPFMPDDMFVVVDALGNNHICRIGSSNKIDAEHQPNDGAEGK